MITTVLLLGLLLVATGTDVTQHKISAFGGLNGPGGLAGVFGEVKHVRRVGRTDP